MSTGRNISSLVIRAVCGDTGGEHTGVVPCVAKENSDCTGENNGRTGVCACGASVNVDCTGENTVCTGENVDCTGENGSSGCGVNENAGCTGENICCCCTGVGCEYAIFAGSGCDVNGTLGCAGENAVFTSSGAPLWGEYGVNAERWGEYGGRLDVRGDARTSTGKTALLGVVASDTCSVDGGYRGNGCFSSPRYTGGGDAACCGMLKALSVGVRGGAVDMKLAVDFLVLRLMASYGSRSGDSYAARRARPCWRLRWQAHVPMRMKMRATPPPTETIMISVVVEKGLAFFCGAAEGVGEAVGEAVGSPGSVGRGGRGGSGGASTQPPFGPPGAHVWVVLACVLHDLEIFK